MTGDNDTFAAGRSPQDDAEPIDARTQVEIQLAVGVITRRLLTAGLGTSKNTIGALVRDGHLVPLRPGTETLFLVDEVRACFSKRPTLRRPRRPK